MCFCLASLCIRQQVVVCVWSAWLVGLSGSRVAAAVAFPPAAGFVHHFCISQVWCGPTHIYVSVRVRACEQALPLQPPHRDVVLSTDISWCMSVAGVRGCISALLEMYVGWLRSLGLASAVKYLSPNSTSGVCPQPIIIHHQGQPSPRLQRRYEGGRLLNVQQQCRCRVQLHCLARSY